MIVISAKRERETVLREHLMLSINAELNKQLKEQGEWGLIGLVWKVIRRMSGEREH